MQFSPRRMRQKLSFLGLGAMGYPMAGHLAKAGHAVTVFNRTRAKAEAWAREFGGSDAPTPAAAARHAEIALICVGGDEDVRAVMLGPDGVFAGLARGGSVVDHTTTSSALARELAAAARERGLGFVDAPVAGGVHGAKHGRLSVMAGGEPEDFARVESTLRCYAAELQHMGPSGSGQLAKMANQICGTGIIQSLAEALAFAEAAGLDGGKMLATLAEGSASSWQLQRRGPAMLAKDFSAPGTVGLLHKDLGYGLAEAERLGVALPVTAMVHGFYGEFVAAGRGSFDASALISRLAARRPLVKDEP